MCGIFYGNSVDAKAKLALQKVRGLHSIGIVDTESGLLIEAIEDNPTVDKYDDLFEIFNEIEQEESFYKKPNEEHMIFMHHRLASIGDVTMDNNHPFIGNKFMLAQNGTARKWYDSLKPEQQKETDSETLLYYLESKCNTLLECKDELNKIDEIVGTIIIFFGGEILFWSDGTRSTFIDIVEQKSKYNPKETVRFLEALSNFGTSNYYEYSNGFYMIVNAKTGQINEEWFYKDEYNKQLYTNMATHGIIGNKRTELHAPTCDKSFFSTTKKKQTQVTQPLILKSGGKKNDGQINTFKHFHETMSCGMNQVNYLNYKDENYLYSVLSTHMPAPSLVEIPALQYLFHRFRILNYDNTSIQYIYKVLYNIIQEDTYYQDLYSEADRVINQMLYNGSSEDPELSYDYIAVCGTTFVPSNFYTHTKGFKGITMDYKFKSEISSTAVHYKYTMKFDLSKHVTILGNREYVEENFGSYIDALCYISDDVPEVSDEKSNSRFTYDMYRGALQFEPRFTGGIFQESDLDQEDEIYNLYAFVNASYVMGIKLRFLALSDDLITEALQDGGFLKVGETLKDLN